MSTHLERFIVGVLIALQISLPGGSEIFLCIFRKNFMFSGLGSLTIRIQVIIDYTVYDGFL